MMGDRPFGRGSERFMRAFCVYLAAVTRMRYPWTGHTLYPGRAKTWSTYSRQATPGSQTYCAKCKDGGVVHHAAAQIKLKQISSFTSCQATLVSALFLNFV
jgi:hypothetical protein